MYGYQWKLAQFASLNKKKINLFDIHNFYLSYEIKLHKKFIRLNTFVQSCDVYMVI